MWLQTLSVLMELVNITARGCRNIPSVFTLCVFYMGVYMGVAERLPPGMREAPVTENTDITPKTSRVAQAVSESLQ